MFHFDAVVQEMIINGIWETLYMTLASTFMGYVLGLPLGIALAVPTKPESDHSRLYIVCWM